MRFDLDTDNGSARERTGAHGSGNAKGKVNGNGSGNGMAKRVGGGMLVGCPPPGCW